MKPPMKKAKIDYHQFIRELSNHNQGKKPKLPKELENRLRKLTQEEFHDLRHNGSFARIFEKLKDSFAIQRIEDHIKSRQNNKAVRNFHIIKNKSKNKGERTFLVYKDGVLYRNVSPGTFFIWKRLFDKKISVEPIVGSASKAEIKALEKIGCFLEEGDLLIKSEPVGVSFALHPDHPNTRVNTLETLLKSNLVNKLTTDQKMSLTRQIIKTITSIWQEGYVHKHPHLGNWAVEFVKGEPKVTLIDMDGLSKINWGHLATSPILDHGQVKEIIKELRLPREYSKIAYSLLDKKLSQVSKK